MQIYQLLCSSATDVAGAPGLGKTTITVQRAPASDAEANYFAKSRPRSCQSYPLRHHCIEEEFCFRVSSSLQAACINYQNNQNKFVF
jgi:hypothetical protein